MVASVTIATVVGIPAAWACGVLASGGKRLRWIASGFVSVLGGVMLIPLVLHAAAWEATAGKFGIAMLTQTGSRSSGSSYGFFDGLVATAWIHGVHGSAIVALATVFGVSKIPNAIDEQSRLDAGPVARWWTIRLRLALPWIVLGMMAVAGLAATEMTVADLYGYRTLVDTFYLNYALDPSATSLAWACLVPAIVSAALVVHWNRRLRGRYPSEVAGANVQDEPPSAAATRFALVFCTAISIVVAAVPMVGLIGNLGRSVAPDESGELSTTWSAGSVAQRVAEAPSVFASEYIWTAVIAVVTSVVAVAVAWPWVSRTRSVVGHGRFAGPAFFDAITIAMVCTPGPIVGLAVVSFFQWDVPGFSFLYQQTIVPTVIAMLARGLPVSYWIIRGGYAGIPDETLQMAKLDLSPLNRFWQVERPLVLRSLVGAGLATAIVTSGDLPATLPVAPAGVTTVAIRLFGLLHSGVRYQESALVAWYVLAVIVAFWAFRLVYNPGKG